MYTVFFYINYKELFQSFPFSFHTSEGILSDHDILHFYPFYSISVFQLLKTEYNPVPLGAGGAGIVNSLKSLKITTMKKV